MTSVRRSPPRPSRVGRRPGIHDPIPRRRPPFRRVETPAPAPAGRGLFFRVFEPADGFRARVGRAARWEHGPYRRRPPVGTASSGTDRHLLDLGTLTKTVLRSGTARVLSGSVLVALLAVQLVFAVPAVVSDHRASVRALVDLERTRLQTALLYSASDELAARDALLAALLTSLALSDAGDGRHAAPDLRATATAAERARDALPWTRDARLIEAEWRLATENVAGHRPRHARRERRLGPHPRLRERHVRVRAAGEPRRRAVRAARRRALLHPPARRPRRRSCARAAPRARVNIPDPIEFSDADDLAVLATEFNSLIDAQKKAARQVKVKQQYLEFAAHHDPLTHLPNRLMFEDTLKATVREAVVHEAEVRRLPRRSGQLQVLQRPVRAPRRRQDGRRGRQPPPKR